MGNALARKKLVRGLAAVVGLMSCGALLLDTGANRQLAQGVTLAASASAAIRARVDETYGKLPFSFEANQGQTDRRVQFLARGRGYTLFLTATEAVLALNPQSEIRNPQSALLRLRLAGANPSPEAVGLEELPGRSNYFIGNDPSKWRTNVPRYARVKYGNVYPGIDLGLLRKPGPPRI